MSKDATSPSAGTPEVPKARCPEPRPGWCGRCRDGRADGRSDHDPHTSPLRRIAEDFPSDTAIEVYLTQLAASGPLLAIQFTQPGEEPASFLLTFDQLRRLSAALQQLITAAAPHRPS